MSVVNLDTIEEDKRRSEVELEGELHVVDMFSSCAQFLSPRRLQELNALAELIRDKVEPHVHTKLQRGQIVQPDKDADEFPHIKAMFETELAFAYSILAATGRRDERKDFFEEGNCLSRQGYDGIRQNLTYSSNFLNALLRIATKHYFYVAWYKLQQVQTGISNVPDETVEQTLKNSVEFYQSAFRTLFRDKRIEPSAALIKNIDILERDAAESEGEPFVSDSAEINNETARKIVEKFGKTGPRLWTPDTQPQIQFALADLVERLNQVRILAEQCRPI